ncbi:APC family permease [Brevibacillus sp. NRS-1366]|uniref:APC family permease n=1 Tax=Brevibacillus sp. NRS-1366 TaxID=3233899 RepID=UPI003D2092C1
MNSETGGLKRSLGFFSVLILGIGLLVPTSAFFVYGIAAGITNGHVPAVYAFAAMAIFFTVLSYAKMSKVFPRAGSAYTYVQQTFHSNTGFLVGWTTLFDYLFLPFTYVLSVTIYLEPLFPEVPLWVWVVAIMLIMTIANVFNVKVAVSFTTLLIIVQLVTIAIFIALLIKYQLTQDPTHLFSLQAFYSPSLTWPTLLSGAVILAYTFIGFDAVSTLAEETHNPTKTIPKVMITLALFIGVLYVILTYFMQSAFPDISVFTSPDGAAFEIAQQIGGIFFSSLFLGVVIASCLVGGISAQMSISRLLFAMGRDNVIPRRIFGYLHPKSGIPIYNILLIGGLGMNAVFLTLDQVASIISFGAYTAFTFVNLCVIKHYFIGSKTKTGKEILLHFIFPCIGILFIAAMWFNISKIALILGVLWVSCGFVYLLFLTNGFKKPAPTLALDQSEKEPDSPSLSRETSQPEMNLS